MAGMRDGGNSIGIADLDKLAQVRQYQHTVPLKSAPPSPLIS